MNYESIDIDTHIKLVQLQTSQADRLFELTDNNRDYLGEFLPWVPYVKTVDDSRKHIEETLENRAKGSTFTYGIAYDGEVVGDISLRNMKDVSRSPEIGYWISPDYSGKGLTTRSVQALTKIGLEALGLEEIIIRANPDNVASNKVAEKSGYILVGNEADDGESLNIWSTKK